MSLASATLLGFGIAAHMSAVLWIGGSLGAHFQQLLVMHGHFQLFGWMAVLLVGVSLFVFPRMLGAPLVAIERQGLIFLLLSAGLLLELSLLLFLDPHYLMLHYLLLSASVLQFSAVGVWAATLIWRVNKSRNNRADLIRLWPWFACMFFGIIFYTGSRLFVSASIVLGVDNGWLLSVAQEIFVRCTLVGAILGFGLKMLPVFMGLRAPRWPVLTNAALYGASILFIIASHFVHFYDPAVSGVAYAVGRIGVGIVAVWYVIALDPFYLFEHRNRQSLKVLRPDEKTIRGHFADKGEFGRWELFIYAGLCWLCFASLLDVIGGFLFFTNNAMLIPFVALRHAYLVGFASNVVIGMSYRLLPGLLVRPLRSRKLVAIVAVAFNVAALLRVFASIAPLLLNGFGQYTLATLGISGLLAFVVVCGFAAQVVFGRSAPRVANISINSRHKNKKESYGTVENGQ